MNIEQYRITLIQTRRLTMTLEKAELKKGNIDNSELFMMLKKMNKFHILKL